ncbi:serine protease [Apophysomyces ossiformis]|uniref:Serine protease n=1 Tax=Apophysomyces ossiformis TaxID=679940 RepID=A0A8H7BKN4_9FUNG|nr:serine protease [Apophysomyces ossiformis]
MKLSTLANVLLLSGYAIAVPMMDPLRFSDGHVAPLYASNEAEPIENSYIVILKKQTTSNLLEDNAKLVHALASENVSKSSLLHAAGNGVTHVYNMPSLKGFAGTFDRDVINYIRRMKDVAYVEKDSMVYASELQRNAPWGLARISQRDGLTLKTFNKYEHDPNGGDGVNVYVIDTGINTEHIDFESRAVWGTTVPLDDTDADNNGHGSHCAGVIAGKRYGVAKKARPIAVKVLGSNGSGTMRDVIKGIEWAILDHKNQTDKGDKKFKGSVANMSLGAGKLRALNAAINTAVEQGIVFAVAAGNDNKNACDFSPASAESAITVAASRVTDERAYFSNFGPCVDVFAPGVNIQSVWIGSKYATKAVSGTSMAAPHVAGLAAYLLSSKENAGFSPKQIKDKILSSSTPNILKSLPEGTPNLLIFNGAQS